MATDQGLKIAVIGPTQSGKTCLAVGLRSISTSGFTIQPVDEDARRYLDDLKVALCSKGAWPEASNLGTNKSLRFDFLKKHKKPIRVEFPEYSGEMLQADRFTDFANKHLRGLDGVVLLVNPGAGAFQPSDRPSDLSVVFEDYVAQYDHVLSFLRDPNNESDKAFVALTITAADRIGGDLKGRRDLFNECVQRLSNTLTSSGFNWKRFDVTVTGHLEDQEEPKLAKGRRNSAAKPFLWILDRLIWQPLWVATLKRVRNVAFAIIGLAALCGIGFGVYAWKAYEEIFGAGRCLAENIQGCKNCDDLKAVAHEFISLQTRRGLFAEKARNIASSLEPRVWNAFKSEITKKTSDIRANPEERGADCTKVDSLFASYSPKEVSCKNEWTEMKTRWDADKLDYQERFTVAQILKRVRLPLEGLAGTHGEKTMESLYSLYLKLDGLKPRLGESIRLKEGLASDIDARVAKEWREFAIPAFECAAKVRVTDEATRAFVDRLNAWRPATANGAAAKAELLAYVTNAIPCLREEWKSGCRERTEAWIGENVCFEKKRTGQGSLWDAYDGFAKEEEKRGNPFVHTRALQAVYKQVEEWIESDVKAFGDLDGDKESYREDVEKAYIRFKKLCIEVFRRNKNGIEQKTSWASHFAIDCEKDGQLNAAGRCFPQTLTVEKCEGRIDYGAKDAADNYKDFRNFYKGTDLRVDIEVARFANDSDAPIRYSLKTTRQPSLLKEDNHNWIKMELEPFEIRLHAFDVLKMDLFATDMIRVGRDLKCAVTNRSMVACNIALWKTMEFGGELDLKNATIITPGAMLTTRDLTPDACMRIGWRLSGKSMQDYVEEAKKKAELARLAEQRESAK